MPDAAIGRLSEMTSMGDAAQIRLIVEQAVEAAIKCTPGVMTQTFVTHAEMERAMEKLETRLEVRLENTMLKTRNWVLGGIIASAVMFGGGFLGLLNQFNRTADTVQQMQVMLESRRDWIGEMENRDRRQDESLIKLDREYDPVPYQVNPR